ncbi:branched-chain amino acid aminotransferase [Nemorincola caseinilytica]|uniref:branched-chain-amino-acid transaminase n=1 Tax=Nemorincola caseinilytica TaxID=2054315 RepID=A0ABP8N8G0_9BACT
MEQTISITSHTERKVTDTRALPFGKVPTEHMFIAEYKDGKWQNASVTPFHDLSLSPIALCLHYGQTVFEGMKAFRMNDGNINVFRMDKHYDRFNLSLQRMCMPAVPKDLFVNAIHQLVAIDADWVPTDEDGSLYIRPFMIATEARIGVKVADEYLFMVVCSPAFLYYSQPLRVKVETTYVRAAEGGTGMAKCGGNYGGAFYPAGLAREEGFDQVLWTDSKTHEYIEESGTMNAMFFIDDTLITPSLSGSILDGVTRNSLLSIARDKGVRVEERPIKYTELLAAFQAGKRVEAFGAGTAAVVAPIATISIHGTDHACYTGKDAMMYKLRSWLYDIRIGAAPDTHHWNYIIR